MHKLAVEFFGTMLLMYVILATGNWLAIGAALAVAVLIGEPISSGAFNPAVVLSLYSAGRLQRRDVLPYIVCETAGAIGALWAYKHFSH